MGDGANEQNWLQRLGQAFSSEPQDRMDVVHLLREAEKRNVIDIDALSMIEGVLHISEMRVSDIMIPRSQMATISDDGTFEEILSLITESGYSRFPVTGDNKDEVKGILLAKDLLRFCMPNNQEKLKLNELVRPAIFVPENKRLNLLLHDFKRNQQHLAMVVDEYGGVTGLVTIEDMLEQIVGDITDETDFEDEALIRKHRGGHFAVKAITPIEEFNEYFKCSFSDEKFDTIGGFISNAFGELPESSATISIQGFEFTIINADNRRIHLLQVRQISNKKGPH